MSRTPTGRINRGKRSGMILSMAMILAAGVAGPAAAAAVRPGDYCLAEDLVAGDDGPPLGASFADARVQKKSGRWWFRFSTSMPDSGQIVGTGTVLLHPRAAGDFTFAFTDNWGARGVGTVKAKGRGIQVRIRRTGPASSDWGDNAGRNYGTFVLQRAPCRQDG